MKLLFVCSGNTCRSPLAVAAWRDAVKSYPTLSLDVESAGVFANSGSAASPHAVAVARRMWDIDISQHRARALNFKLIDSADRILVMTPEHAVLVCERFTRAAHKVLCLGAFLSDGKSQLNSDAARLERLLSEAGLSDEIETADAQSTLFATPAIADPFGGTREDYAECAQQLHRAVKNLAQSLATEINPRDTPAGELPSL